MNLSARARDGPLPWRVGLSSRYRNVVPKKS